MGKGTSGRVGWEGKIVRINPKIVSPLFLYGFGSFYGDLRRTNRHKIKKATV